MTNGAKTNGETSQIPNIIQNYSPKEDDFQREIIAH